MRPRSASTSTLTSRASARSSPASARGWLIITRDSMITQNRNEITAVRENNAKMVALN
ncbi:MAG TPA: hypothetical protein VFQ68_18465 [Streptosporangiaceae bacterium]|nr:hypothetical protein [Streptosporangiaceae bacterium]